MSIASIPGIAALAFSLLLLMYHGWNDQLIAP
jgi:hypothetical protein